MATYLGIDAGGTGTRALAWEYPARTWKEADHGVPASLSSVAEDRVLEPLTQVARQVLGTEGPADVAFVGAAGCVTEADRAWIAAGLKRAEVARRVIVHHDAYTAWMGATAPSLDGVLVVAGTGSSVFTRDAADHEILVGGYGYRFGDEGGGADLGREALRAASAEEDGYGPSSSLRMRILNRLRVRSMRQVMVMARTREARWLAGFAPLLLEAADAGDSVALAILRHRLDLLARQITAAAVASGKTPGEPVTLYGAGGLMSSRRYCDQLRQGLSAIWGSGSSLRTAERTALHGALLAALAADGLSLNDVLAHWPQAAGS